MATQKPISTISYNTESFLREKLEAWHKAHIIQSYQYICHKGEDGDKDHIHVRLEPNKRIDPMELQDALREFQLGKDKPLGVRPFRPSKEEDWLLYAVHDADYLRYKYSGGENYEKMPYKWQDIKAPEDYDVEVAFLRARSKLEHTAGNIASRMQQGDNPMKLITGGENVYIVNAVMRALQVTDYARIAEELRETRDRLENLEKAIKSYGFRIEYDDLGNVLLDK